MTAQTIAQAKAATPESLLDFLAKLPTTSEAQVLYALVLGCLLGMIGHYTKQYLSSDIQGSLWDYLYRQHPRRTALALFGVLTWSAGEVGSGIFMSEAGVFVGWGLVILSGLKTGYLGDSIANKAATKPAAEP